MSTNEESVMEMFHQAFNGNEKEINLLAASMLCSIMSQEEDPDSKIFDKVIELSLEKIKSKDILQSLKSLELLGECMSKSGDLFQRKIARYTFLNNFIKLVSKKYLGQETPDEIRNKIMDYLLLWTTEYPNKTRIKDAYELLRKEGFDHKCKITDSSIPQSTTRKCSSILSPEVDEKLKKLLKSTNPEDTKSANLLIKYYYEQDYKKSKLILQQEEELDKAIITITLLKDMIDNCSDGQVTDALEELYDQCLKLRPIIQKLPEMIDKTDLLNKALEVNDDLTDVITKYENLLQHKDCASETIEQNSEIIDSNIIDTEIENITETVESLENVITDDEALKSIFFDNPPVTEIPLEPIPVYKEENKMNENQATNSQEDTDVSNNFKRSKNGFLSYIDKASEDLFKENLKSDIRIGTFKKKEEKVSLNEMKGKTSDEKVEKSDSDQSLNSKLEENKPEKQIDPITVQDTQNFAIFDIENLEVLLSSMSMKNQTEENTLNEENIENLKKDFCLSEDEDILSVNSLILSDNKISDINENSKEIKKLSDISLELKSIKANKRQKIMDEMDGLQIELNFAKDRLEDDIFVIVISVVNKGQISIRNYHLDAGVSKPCKIRLLEPSSTYLDGIEPLQLPTKDIKQILLLFNPTKQPVDITFILSYNLGDDVDPIKEPISVKDISYN